MTDQELKQLAELIAEQAIFCTKEVLTSDEAARYMGVSKSYLYKLTMRQQIPHYKPLGKMCYFNRLELEQWLQSNRVSTTGEINEAAQSYCMGNKVANGYESEKRIIQDPYKRGDILVSARGITFIYSGENGVSDGERRMGVLARVADEGLTVYKRGEWGYVSCIKAKRVRYANKGEKEGFIDYMHRYGKDWDESLKDVIDYVWPKENEKVYTVGGNGDVRTFAYNSKGILKEMLEAGNLFKTEQEAEAMAEKFRKILKEGKQ